MAVKQNAEYKPTTCYVVSSRLVTHSCTCCCCVSHTVTVPCPSPPPPPTDDSFDVIVDALYVDWNDNSEAEVAIQVEAEATFSAEHDYRMAVWKSSDAYVAFSALDDVDEDESDISMFSCTETTCDCTYIDFTCYQPLWDVIVEATQSLVENDCEDFPTTIKGSTKDSDSSSSSSASRKRAEKDRLSHPIGTTQDCYFSIKTCRSARWTVLNPQTMMICFYVFLGVLIGPFFCLFMQWMVRICRNGGGWLVSFMLLTAFVFSFGTSMLVQYRRTYGLVLMILGCLGMVALFFMVLAALEIFDLCGIFSNFGATASMFAHQKFDQVVQIHTDYVQFEDLKRDYRELGSQSELNTQLQISSGDREGAKEPSFVVVKSFGLPQFSE